MIESGKFGIGYFKIDMQDGMEIFLSVSLHFEYGPGIQRDGITAPRMTDPKSVDYIASNNPSNLLIKNLNATFAILSFKSLNEDIILF
ncbi:MAG: hypothetical protein E3K36_16100 [Candidatus Brocadia sp.]|nr:hypothetical protein [Candidatus Brocadia sp.]